MAAVTTLVALVGDDADELAQHVGRVASNVAAVAVGPCGGDALEATGVARRAWSEAARRSAVYTLVGVDPLVAVVGQWAARLEGRANDLEVAIGSVEGLPMPDYYLIADDLSEPHVHWYLGPLEELAPRRIVPVSTSVSSVLGALAELPYGRALPGTREVAELARDYVPIPEIVRAGSMVVDSDG